MTSEQLQALLDANQLNSQQDAAEWLGVGQATVSRWLSGIQPIPRWLSVWSKRIK